MGNKFSSGKFAIAECDQCSFRYPLGKLRKLVVKGQIKEIKVCPECWDPDHPQLMLGMYPVEDPQAVRQPRPDFSGYPQSRGLTLQLLIGPLTPQSEFVLGQVLGIGSVGQVTFQIT